MFDKFCHQQFDFKKVNMLSLCTIWDSTDLTLKITIRFPRVTLDVFTWEAKSETPLERSASPVNQHVASKISSKQNKIIISLVQTKTKNLYSSRPLSKYS